MKKLGLTKSALLALSLVGFLTTTASAQLRTLTGYSPLTLAANDDGYTGFVNFGFTTNFFGTTAVGAYLNNNGNITFSGPLSEYTPFGLAGTDSRIIAPFFADVDTRSAGSGLMTYGQGVLSGHNAFVVDWPNVGVYNHISIFNTFQLVLIDRSDIAVGDFDFEFNYTKINWETGTASGGSRLGLGGDSARVGYSSGGDNPVSFELAGSAINGAFLDGNLTTGLIHNQYGTPFDGANMDGRYAFSVRNGQVVVNGAVPEPSTYGMIGAAVLLAGVMLRRRFSKR